jgi:hypothetical protein
VRHVHRGIGMLSAEVKDGGMPKMLREAVDQWNDAGPSQLLSSAAPSELDSTASC